MVFNTGTAVTIDTVLDFLSNTGNHNSGQQLVSKRDVLEGILDPDGKKVNVFMRAQSLIQNNSGLIDSQKELYGDAFNNYLLNNSELARNVNTDIPDVNASYGGTLTGDFYSNVADAGKLYTNLYNNTNNFEGDLTTIGYYSVDESEVDSQHPRIVPSSIKIQEQLLNMPIPTVRSKASGLSPDHRSKHIVHLDILYPTFESFSTSKENYPSFINLLNMFKYMPINGILSSALSSYFLSEFTFPRLFNTLKKFSLNEAVFSTSIDNFNAEDVEKKKRDYILEQLQNESLADIKRMLEDEDPLLDIGVNALTEALDSKSYDTYSNEVYNQIDKGALSLSEIKFPVPVAFKSASVQTMQDMPGAVLARLAFTITSSPAFPYGSVMYRKKDGTPSFDATDCYWGKKYVELASKNQVKDAEKTIVAYKEEYKQVNNNPELSLNDIALYYSDLEHGVIGYNTANYPSDIVLEKISGTFNSKCIEMPLMNSKFPHVQYMGLNDNGFQLIFAVKNKKAIADFMRLKAKMLDYEKKGTIQNSSAIIENKFLNSIGVYFVSPQSIALESDPDNPDFYHLVITLAENSQKYGFEEKLELESGVLPADTLQGFKKYFYDLYRIWYYINFVDHKNKISISLPSTSNKTLRPGERFNDVVDKLDKLMAAFGIKKEYSSIKVPAIFCPMQDIHDVAYGPIFYGIMDAYSRASEGRPFDGNTLSYLPELEFYKSIENTRGFGAIASRHTTRSIVQGMIDICFGAQYYAIVSGPGAQYIGRSPMRGVNANENLKKVLFGNIDQNELFALLGEIENTSLGPHTDSAAEVSLSANAVNLIDMFHKAKNPIPEEVWNGAFDAIVQRKFTKGIGSRSFVGIQQMDAAFIQFTSLVFGYGNSWKMVQSEINGTTDIKSHLELWAGRNGGGNQNLIWGASINLSEINKKEEKANEFNNRKINLYPDMYCPTYQQLLMSDEDFSKLTADIFIDKAAEFLKIFAPKHGDFGTMPEFKEISELYNAQLDPQKYISNAVSVGLDNYVDPDIFYVRRRDKNLMHKALLESKERIDKAEKGIVPLSLPIDINQLQREVLIKLREQDPDSSYSPAIKNNDEIRIWVAERLNHCITKTADMIGDEPRRSIGGETVSAVVDIFNEAFSADTFNEDFVENLIELLQLQRHGADPEEKIVSDPETVVETKKEVIQIPLIVNTNQIIGNVVWTGRKYEVRDTFELFGEKVTYSSGTRDLSFSVFDPGTRYEDEERHLLQTPDFANSMLKSFPTVRLYFIEEDDGGSYFKDDMYGFGDVVECNISSHIYDNDICRMKLANFGGVLSEMNFTDFDYYAQYTDIHGDKQSTKVIDDAGERFLRKIALRPGIPIMIKMGYGNNLDTLKTVFTGEISEVKPGEIVEIVAQGYQTELHHDYGGFYEESIFENPTLFENNEAEYKKFGFLEIINFILLGDAIDGKTGIKARNSMKHLGTPLNLYSAQRGFFGGGNYRYSYENSHRDLGQIFGKTFDNVSQIQATRDGDTFNWLDSLIEKNYTGFKGTDLSRNIYVSSGNNTAINVASEWLVVNSPTIDGLREVVRYMPNFICTVVPYGKDATLFIGDPNLPYEYRPATKIENKFNTKINTFARSYSKQSRLGENNNAYNRFISRVNDEAKRVVTNIEISSNIDKCADYLNLKPILASMVPPINPGYDPTILAKSIHDKISEITKTIGKDVFAKLIYNYFGINHKVQNKFDPQNIIDFAKNLIKYYYHILPFLTKGKTHKNLTKDLTKSIKFDLDYFVLTEEYFKKEAQDRWVIKSIYGGQPYLEEAQRLSEQIRSSLKDALNNKQDDDNFIYNEDNLCQDRVIFEISLFGRGLNTSVVAKPVESSIDPELKGLFSSYYENLHSLNETIKANKKHVNVHNHILLTDQANLIFLIYLIEKVVVDINSSTSSAAKKLLDEVQSVPTSGKDVFKYLPFNYKIYRDQHVITTEHDLIANNIIATESEMWSSVAVKVPSDTIENINGAFNLGMFQSNIEEGDTDTDSNIYRIDSDQDFKIFPFNAAGGINYKGARPGPQDTIENFTEINATTASLAQMVVKFRLAQGLSKMYRGNLITVGRHMKPYDIILLTDNINEMYGRVMVERVIQNFSASEGWTTTIIPSGLTHVNSNYVALKREKPWSYSFGHGDSFRYLEYTILAITLILTIGPVVATAVASSLVAGFKGAVAVGSLFILRGGFTSAIKQLGKNVAKTFTTGGYGYTGGFGALGQRFGSNLATYGMVGTFAAGRVSAGVADIVHQVYETRLHQTLFTTNKNGSVIAVHQPCFSSVLYYKSTPFYAGLEEPLASIAGDHGISNLLDEWRDFWLEFTSTKAVAAEPVPPVLRKTDN